MSTAVTQVGASVPSQASRPAESSRADAQQAFAAPAKDEARVELTRKVQPAPDAFQVRHEVMQEHGLDRVTLFHLGPIDRLRAEVAIASATAVRLAQMQPKISGSFLDVRA